jgi:hypothetical protein
MCRYCMFPRSIIEPIAQRRQAFSLTDLDSDEFFTYGEVLLPDDLRFAVDPFAFAGVVVGLTTDSVLDDAGHLLDNTCVR